MKEKSKLKKILSTQKFGILATCEGSSPYQNIVAFAESGDLKHIIFATPRQTNKYRNLKENKNVSIFIDDRSNSERDLGDATGICVIGSASELSTAKMKSELGRYLGKHPALKEFALSPSTAIFSMRVEKYLMVCRFQNVLEIKP